MKLSIEMSTSKDAMSFDTNEPARATAKILHEDYFFKATFGIFASKAELEGAEEIDEVSEEDKIQVGEIVASFIDEGNCLNDGEDPFIIADDDNADFGIAVAAMQRSPDYEKLSVNKEWKPLLTVYMDTFYIYPEYRNKGIGTYLLSNLGEIFTIFTNRDIRAVSVILKPMCLRGETMTKEEEAAMLRKMRKHFKKAGFKKIENPDCYMCNYGAEDFIWD